MSTAPLGQDPGHTVNPGFLQAPLDEGANRKPAMTSRGHARVATGYTKEKKKNHADQPYGIGPRFAPRQFEAADARCTDMPHSGGKRLPGVFRTPPPRRDPAHGQRSGRS